MLNKPAAWKPVKRRVTYLSHRIVSNEHGVKKYRKTEGAMRIDNFGTLEGRMEINVSRLPVLFCELRQRTCDNRSVTF
jgi:hypothetical protein